MSSASPTQRDQKFQKELHVSWKKPEGGAKVVILKLKEGDFYSLEDPVSISIWEDLMAGKTAAEVLESLVRTYPTQDPEKLAQDLDAFLHDLQQNQVVSPCP